jgi:hypothetical protein
MSGEIIQPGSGAVEQDAGADAFTTIFGTAKPTMDTVRKIKPLLDVVDAKMKTREGFKVKLDAKEHCKLARNRFRAIPDDHVLYGAMNLFKAAERESAPEWWLHAAIGLTFDILSNGRNVSPNVRSGVVDSMMYDEEIHNGYRPGFSAAVVYEMTLDVRRITSEYLPMPAKILELCAESRKRFKRRLRLTEILLDARQAAEDVLIELGEVKVPDDFWDDEFNPEKAVHQWLSGQRPVPLLSAPNQMPFEMPVEREKVMVGAR